MAQRILSATALALGGAALVLGGCSSMASDDLLTSTVVETASPPAEDLATPVPGTARVGLADDTQSEIARLIKLNAPLRDDGTMGSGCAPQEADVIPDGTWFVYISHVSLTGAEVDIACMFGEGSEQWQVARESSVDGGTWANHVVTNDVVHRVAISTQPDVVAYLSRFDWHPVDAATALSDGPRLAERESAGVWIVVEDGLIATVIEPSASPTA